MAKHGLIALCALAVLLAATPIAAEVYKWTDKDGRVHYGDRPPAPQAPELLKDISVYEADAPTNRSAGPRKRTADAAEVASCVASNGTTLYAASWCGQCKKQLALFGASASALPYVECSADGSRNTTRACDSARIKGYPTWVFPSGERRSGVQSVSSLAKLAGCT